MQQAVRVRPELSEAQSLLGATLLQSDNDRGFLTWHAALPEVVLEHPGVWTARGHWAYRQGQLPVAARCFWEAVRRNPNHQQANYQLGQVLPAWTATRTLPPSWNARTPSTVIRRGSPRRGSPSS